MAAMVPVAPILFAEKIAEDRVAMTVAMFLICWILVIVMLIAETLKLPAAFAVLLGLVDVATRAWRKERI